MRRVALTLNRLLGDQRGATTVEYGIILAGIVLAMFGALQTVGTSTAGMWNNVSTKVIEAR